jgi:hypothetical protein
MQQDYIRFIDCRFGRWPRIGQPAQCLKLCADFRRFAID